jgi:excisionase family DNA binding protein
MTVDQPRARTVDELAAALNGLLDALADRVAERVATQLAEPRNDLDRWLTTSEAAERLGMHRDTLLKLATGGVIPSEQDGPGCKRYYRPSALDHWRESRGQRSLGTARRASTRLPRIGKTA